MTTTISGMGSQQAITGASNRMSQNQRLTKLFQSIDTGATGSITKAQFEEAFKNMKPPAGAPAGSNSTAAADAIWAKMDPNNTGSVSQTDFVNAMKSMHPHRHHGSRGGGESSGSGSNVSQWNGPAATLDQSLQSLITSMNQQGNQNLQNLISPTNNLA